MERDHHGRGEDIALVGMACVLPGPDTPEQYWHNIVHKVDCVTEPPPETDVALTVRTGVVRIVNGSAADVPPPGDGENTVTLAEPADTMSPAPIAA